MASRQQRVPCLLLILLCPWVTEVRDAQSLWPKPQQWITKRDAYVIDADSFAFVLGPDSSVGCDIVDQAITRYRKILQEIASGACPSWGREDGKTYVTASLHRRTHRTSDYFTASEQVAAAGLLPLRNLSIFFRSCATYPSQYMDEMYTLAIGGVARAFDLRDLLGEQAASTEEAGEAGEEDRSATLVANTAWGVLRGLESFVQLTYLEPRRRDGNRRLLVNGSFVLDFPRFTVRAVLIDTSRHFIPLAVLKQNLDAMAISKMNAFHWHLVDDQSFPFESRTFPRLHEAGAYDAETAVYRPSDVAEVIEYARLRGIRVIPEFDSPGHTLSWGSAQPDLLSVCHDSRGQPLEERGPIDPSLEGNYAFLQQLLTEVASVFPDAFLHLGGDEVNMTCWSTNPQIQRFMQHINVTSVEELEGYYISRVLEIAASLNKSAVVWQEVLDNGVSLKPDTLVHVWKWFGTTWQEEMARVTAAGLRVILSAPWYLNYIHYGVDWQPFYEAEPTAFPGSTAQKQLVLGGAACMWTEFVDGSELVPRLWPRAAAVAERLWSAKETRDLTDARIRLQRHQCFLQQRGIRVEPINGPSHCPCDHSYL